MNNSRSLLNIGMVIFLSIFIVIFYNKNNAPDKTQHLSHLTLDEINHITINRPNDNDIVFEKQTDAIWLMTKPYNLKAHQFRINTLLSLTQMSVEKFYNINDLNLSQYALDKPRAKITFNKTDIFFGNTNSLNGMRYFLSEQKMALIPDQIYPLVSAQASSFVDLSLLPDDYIITKIQTPTASILKNNNGEWINAQHDTNKTDLTADQIQTLLQNWKLAKAFAVHKYLPRKELGKIEISSHTKTIVFEITDDDPWLILALPDLKIEYHLDASQKGLLFGIALADKTDA